MRRIADAHENDDRKSSAECTQNDNTVSCSFGEMVRGYGTRAALVRWANLAHILTPVATAALVHVAVPVGTVPRPARALLTTCFSTPLILLPEIPAWCGYLAVRCTS